MLSPDFIAMDLNVMWSFSNFEQEHECFLDVFFAKGLIRTRGPYCLDTQYVERIASIINERLINLLFAVKEYKRIFTECQPQLTELKQVQLNEFRIIAASLLKREAPFSNLVLSYDHVISLIKKERVQLERIMTSVYKWIYSSFTVTILKNFTLQGKWVKAISLRGTHIDFAYEQAEYKKIEIEVIEHLNSAESKLLLRDWQDATDVLKLLKPIVKNKHLKMLNGKPGKNSYYLYELYSFAAKVGPMLDNLEVQKVKKLFDGQPLLLNDLDLMQLKVPTQFQITAHFIHRTIKTGEEKKLLTLFDLMVESIERFEKGELLAEEILSGDEQFFILLVLLAQFLLGKYDHIFIDICQQSDLSEETLQKVLANYKQINGSDAFYRYFNKGILEKVGKIVMGSVIGSFKN